MTAPAASSLLFASSAVSLATPERILVPGVSAMPLGLNETQAGELADNLDHFDLLRAGVLEDNVEFGLFFSFFCRASGNGGHCGNRSGSGDAPFFFQCFDQFGRLPER